MGAEPGAEQRRRLPHRRVAIDAVATLTVSDWLRQETITCPWCWERLVLEFDLSAGAQRYVEDCAVCCRPMDVSFRVEDGALAGVSAERTD